jgi:hypothetical protein
MSCDSGLYATTQTAALFFVVLWPVGVPLLYALLLFGSREALRTGSSTPLSRATSFLSGEYTISAFWWEPLEMVRKLTVTGWVLLISEQSELARVLVALLITIAFQALHFAVKPFKRYSARWREGQSASTLAIPTHTSQGTERILHTCSLVAKSPSFTTLLFPGPACAGIAVLRMVR